MVPFLLWPLTAGVRRPRLLHHGLGQGEVELQKEQLKNKKKGKYKDNNLSLVYVVLCFTLPLSMEDTYKCSSLGHQRKDINGFDRISQTDEL